MSEPCVSGENDPGHRDEREDGREVACGTRTEEKEEEAVDVDQQVPIPGVQTLPATRGPLVESTSLLASGVPREPRRVVSAAGVVSFQRPPSDALLATASSIVDDRTRHPPANAKDEHRRASKELASRLRRTVANVCRDPEPEVREASAEDLYSYITSVDNFLCGIGYVEAVNAALDEFVAKRPCYA